MAPMKKRAEKEGGKKKEMITVEVKSNSKKLWRSRLRRRHPSLQMRLGRRQKQVPLDRFLVKVAQKEKESEFPLFLMGKSTLIYECFGLQACFVAHQVGEV
jgi:hypothetical protein